MPGPAPAKTRRRANVPARGDWRPTPGMGWQHGPVPTPPEGLLAETVGTWEAWMASWVASTWSVHHLPNLRTVIRLQDVVSRALLEPFIETVTDKGTFYTRRPCPAAELRQWLDRLGLTRKGEQDQRIQAPEPTSAGERPAHLRVVGSRRDA